MKKVIIYAGVIAASLALIAWKLNANQRENAARTAVVKESMSGAVPVTIDTVEHQTLNASFKENGKFEAVNQIELTSEISGRVKELYVKEGSAVKAGQPLARIDNEILSADRVAAQARLDQAKQNLQRYEQALQSGGVTQKQVDDARLQLETEQAHFVQASKNLSNAVVKAPVSGIINERFVEIGSYLAPGNKIFEIVDDKKLKLALSVTEYQIVQIKTGDKVAVSASVYPEVTYEGTVTFVSAKGDASLNYPIEIEIKNIPGKELKAGMYGSAQFKSAGQASALLIPRSAFRGGVSSNRIFVNDNGKASIRNVVAGRVHGSSVEIRDGLKPGDQVITSGLINLIEGTPIAVIQ